jgi:hypothetical protein
MNIRYILALLPAVAFAEGVPPKPAPVPVSVSGAVAGAVAGSVAGADSYSTATANPSASSLSTQTQTASSSTTNANTVSAASDSSSGGNTQQTSFRAPQNAPAVATAPAPIVGCGASASGGGSNTGGAAVLGFAWTTRECQGWTLASAYAALGDRVTACRVLNAQNTARRAKRRGVTLPDCETLTVPPSEVVRLIDTPPDLSSYVRKEDLREVADRITRQMVHK